MEELYFEEFSQPTVKNQLNSSELEKKLNESSLTPIAYFDADTPFKYLEILEMAIQEEGENSYFFVPLIHDLKRETVNGNDSMVLNLIDEIEELLDVRFNERR